MFRRFFYNIPKRNRRDCDDGIHHRDRNTMATEFRGRGNRNDELLIKSEERNEKKKQQQRPKKNKGGTKEEEDAEKEILDNGTHDNEKKNEHEKNMGGGFKKWRNFFLYFGAASAS